MSDLVDLPSEPAPQPTQPTYDHSAPVAPPPKPNKFKRLFAFTVHNDFIQAGFILLVLAFVAGAGYYIGWHRGYNAASNAPSNGQCSALTYNTACYSNDQHDLLDEPVINLYPTKTETVNVQLHYAAGFSYTLPTYNPTSGWNVLATPSGSLTNLADGKQYPYLIWEGNPPPIAINMSSGFVVPGDQTSAFLHKELPIIGLSPSETNAFVAYWLPRMTNNTYNLIHFVGTAYTDYAKLIISPKPDSELRVLMAFKALDKPIVVSPQTFPTFQRNGFTVVEWGGTELTAN